MSLCVLSHSLFQDWTLSFMYPAAIIASVGVVIFLFLVPKPSHVGLSLNTQSKDPEKNAMNEESEKAISFFGAFLIPGVIEFSLCLFSAKLVYYVFLFWLPHYIKVTLRNVPRISQY